jgi:glutamate-1-semialdehyde aminotransferase
MIIEKHLKDINDYTSNTINATYPDGQDIEVFTFQSLEKSWEEAKLVSEREHVTQYIKKNPETFKIYNIEYHTDLSDMRWTLDDPFDYKFFTSLFSSFLVLSEDLTMEDILKYLKNDPTLTKINSHITRDEGLQKSLRDDCGINKNGVRMGKGQKLYKKAKKMIPGGTQLLSKRPEMFLPDFWPAYYSKAKGCEVWDLDGNKYIDMSYMGIGACVLGYADADIDNAVKKAIDEGSASTLNCPEEVELAESILKLHSWAQMARFARTGGEAMTIAIRIARAKTGRDKILFCGYHGWHDWYLSSNLSDNKALDGHLLPGLSPAGVPRGLKGTALPFAYNDTEAFMKLVKKHNKEIAAIVIEPIRNHYPNADFLKAIEAQAKKFGAVLIADEVSAGFRLTIGGAHKILELTPDIAVFSKAIGNGYPIAVIIGNKNVMSAAEKTFISSTNWTERIGTVAALATINKFKQCKVDKHLSRIGKMVQKGWQEAAKKNNLKIEVQGIYPIGHFDFLCNNPLVLKTLFTQLMLEEGFLATNAFYASYAHKSEHIKKYIYAVDRVFAKLKEMIASGRLEASLKGPVCHAGFRRLT